MCGNQVKPPQLQTARVQVLNSQQVPLRPLMALHLGCEAGEVINANASEDHPEGKRSNECSDLDPNLAYSEFPKNTGSFPRPASSEILGPGKFWNLETCLGWQCGARSQGGLRNTYDQILRFP